MDVSIVIVNYNTISLVKNCLDSIIAKVTDISYEVIIVDNHSDDDIGILLELYTSMNLKCINTEDNIGFGRANNLGFKYCSGRNILCLNPDTVLINNAVKILSDYLDAHNEVGACGGNLYNVDDKPALSFRRIFPSTFWELNELFHLLPEKFIYGDNRIFNNSGKAMSVAYITGADLMIKKNVLDMTSGFSSEFFMYFEETDLCYRIRMLGYEIMSIPEAEIVHLEGGSFCDRINEQKIRYIETSRINFYLKNVSPESFRFADFIYKFFLRSRIVLSMNNSRHKYYKTRYMAYKEARNLL